MIRSLRWRLQVWYALVLIGVVAGFAGILYYREREVRFQEIDRRLQGWTQYLDVSLRGLPPHELKGGPPGKPPPKGPRPKDDKWPGPPPKSRARMLADLDLPRASYEVARPYFVIWRADGTILKSSLPSESVTESPAERALRPVHPTVIQHGEWREAVLLGPHRTQILVGVSVSRDLDELTAYAWQLAGLGGGALVLGLAGGWLIAARILRPLAAISQTASAISATSLDQRIDTRRLDSELVDLASVLNATFDRLEQEFARQTRFTADASHELRTPLTVVRTHAELALARPRNAEEYREALDVCLRAAQRMSGLVDSLLTLARADAGRLDLRREPVDLAQVVADCVTLLQPLLAAKELALDVELTPVQVHGDTDRLAQVVTNLLSNAVQYTPPGGQVTIRVGAADGTALLAVRDTGCGIAAADRPQVFERFYRVDKARARASGGSGLGLAICKSIIEAHGGTIGFTDAANGGTEFWVRLPQP